MLKTKLLVPIVLVISVLLTGCTSQPRLPHETQVYGLQTAWSGFDSTQRQYLCTSWNTGAHDFMLERFAAGSGYMFDDQLVESFFDAECTRPQA